DQTRSRNHRVFSEDVGRPRDSLSNAHQYVFEGVRGDREALATALEAGESKTRSIGRLLMKCWAAGLGDCGTKQSREHYMSAGLWKGRTVRLRGFPWIDGDEQEIGLSSFQARVLCEKHNNILSSLDREAVKIFDGLEMSLRQVADLQSRRPSYSYRKPITRSVNGVRFERWV